MPNSTNSLDRRRNAWREDLAAETLREQIDVPRYSEGRKAFVRWPAAPMRREPRYDAALDTEVLHGERLTVYDVAEGWAWVQLARDAYVGYVPQEAITVTMPEPTHRVRALGTFVYAAADIKSPLLMHLSLNAELALAGGDDRFSKLATGGYIINRHIAALTRHALDYVEVAERFIGTPYLWGGRTRLGVDCSGLIQLALEAAGIPAPRDSDMQAAEIGETLAIPANLEGLGRGDLVCWRGHIGVMMDGILLLHANAHHMAVAVEPLAEAVDRIERTGSAITTIRRLPMLGIRP